MSSGDGTAAAPSGAPPITVPIDAPPVAPPQSGAQQHPELMVGAALVGGFVTALILRRLGGRS